MGKKITPALTFMLLSFHLYCIGVEVEVPKTDISKSVQIKPKLSVQTDTTNSENVFVFLNSGELTL